MTITDERPQEETRLDPLDGTISALEDALEQLRGAREYGGSPLELRTRAAMVRRAAEALEGLPLGLYREALECDAEAAAREAAVEAREALDRAAAAVEAAQEAYDATAAPESEAARKLMDAKHLAEEAAGALAQAPPDRAEPEDRDKLQEQLHRRQEGVEAYWAEFARAEQARTDAREALERAQAAHRKAEGDLAAAEDAVEHPDPESLDNQTLIKALKSGWTHHLDNPSPRVQAVCRVIAEDIAGQRGWYSDLAEARIERSHGRKMIASIRAGRGITLGDVRGTYNLGVIRPGDRVIASGNFAHPARAQ